MHHSAHLYHTLGYSRRFSVLRESRTHPYSEVSERPGCLKSCIHAHLSQWVRRTSIKGDWLSSKGAGRGVQVGGGSNCVSLLTLRGSWHHAPPLPVRKAMMPLGSASILIEGDDA